MVHGSYVRNEMSSDLVKLQSPDLNAILPILVVGVDGATAATVEKRNEQRRRQQFESEKLNQEFQLAVAQKNAVLSQHLTDALQDKAYALLVSLRRKHPMHREVALADGTTEMQVMKGLYNGGDMMREFIQWLKKDVRPDEVEFHQDVIAEMRKHPLPDNATEEQLSERIAEMLSKHNSMLGDQAYEGAKLSTFIVKQLPESLVESRAAMLAKISKNRLYADDPDEVLEDCCDLLRNVHKRANGVPALGCFGVDGIAYVPPISWEGRPMSRRKRRRSGVRRNSYSRKEWRHAPPEALK